MKRKPILWTVFVVVTVTLALLGWVALTIQPTSFAAPVAARPVDEPKKDRPPTAANTRAVKPIDERADDGTAGDDRPSVSKPNPAGSSDGSSATSNTPNVSLPKAQEPAPELSDAFDGPPAPKRRLTGKPADDSRVTETHALKHQNAEQIAELLVKLVPDLQVSFDARSNSVVVWNVSPQTRQRVSEIIGKLDVVAKPLTPQPGGNVSLAPAVEDQSVPKRRAGSETSPIADLDGDVAADVFVADRQPAPQLAGEWDGWGQVTLRQVRPGTFEGTYTGTYGTAPGKITLEWKGERFYGTWSEGEKDRFGELSARLAPDGQTIFGAYSADANSKINPGSPRLADFQWTRGETSPVRNYPLLGVARLRQSPGATESRLDPDNPFAPAVNDDSVDLQAAKRYLAADEETRKVVGRVRLRLLEDKLFVEDAPPVSPDDRAELATSVRRTFEARQELLRQEIAQFQARLVRLNRMLADRDRAKDKIIDRRVEELLNPNLRWDATGNMPSGTGSSAGTSATARPQTPSSGEKPNAPASSAGPHPPRSDSSYVPPVPPAGTAPPRSDSSLPGPGLGFPNPKFLSSDKNAPAANAPGMPGTIDTPALPGQRVLKVFKLRHKNTDHISRLLTKLIGDEIRFSADAATNSLIVFARDDELKAFAALLQELDLEPASGVGSPSAQESSVLPALSDSLDQDATAGKTNAIKRFDPNQPPVRQFVTIGSVSVLDPGHGRIEVSLKEPGSAKVGDFFEIARPIADDQNSHTRFGRIRVIEVRPSGEDVLAVLTHSTRQKTESRWEWMSPDLGDVVSRPLTDTQSAVESPESKRIAGLLRDKLGLELQPITLEKSAGPVSNAGLLVTNVVPDSLADKAGLKVDDILIGVHVWETRTLDNLKFIVEKLENPEPNAPVEDAKLRVWRGGKQITLFFPPRLQPTKPDSNTGTVPQ